MKTGTLSSNEEILGSQFKNAFFIICLLELIHSAASLTDTFFIGNYIGSMGMAAMGYARPFFSFVDIVCGPLGLGMQLICSNHIGRGDMKSAQKVFSGSLTVGLSIAVLLMAFGLFQTPLITSIYGTGNNTAEVIPLANQYMRGLFIGVPAMIAFGILSPIVQLGNGKNLITIGIICQFVVDVVGDALSVLVFDRGMFGLGLTTAISYYAATIPLVIYFLRKNTILKLRLSFMVPADMKNVTNAGASKAIKRICNTIKPIILNALSLLLGTALALSAYSITNQIRDILISFSAGATSSVVLIGSLLYSQRDREGLNTLLKISLTSIGAITVLGILCIVFSEPIADIFISDSEEVIRMAALSIRCVGIMIPFSTLNGIFISFQQIKKEYKLVNMLSYLNRLILIVATSCFMGLVFGTNGLWWALPTSEIINTIILLVIIRKKNGRLPKEPLDFMCISPDFGYKPGEYVEVTFKEKDDVLQLQKTVNDFCESHDIDSRRSYFTYLALEELAMNVIEHGFPKCKYSPVMHVWLTYDKGDIILRFQDNCPGFNVMKHCSALAEANPESSVGLRIVSKISKRMNYVNSLGTNNLMITI